MNTGDLTENLNRFQIQPYTNENDEICGLAVNIMGLVFVLMLDPPNLVRNPQFKSAKYISTPDRLNALAMIDQVLHARELHSLRMSKDRN
jgi:hypothetical protein